MPTCMYKTEMTVDQERPFKEKHKEVSQFEKYFGETPFVYLVYLFFLEKRAPRRSITYMGRRIKRKGR
jgi:hypothetical protein